MARARALPGSESGASSPGRYASVREYHQRELARINGLDDVVYDYLKKIEGPVHRDRLRQMNARQPVRIPAWALTDFDDGAKDLRDWMGRQDDVLVWPDDSVSPAPKLKADEAYVDPCVWRASWEMAGHTPRWPLD